MQKIIINIPLNQIEVKNENNEEILPIGTDFNVADFRSKSEIEQVIKNRLVSSGSISADDINNYEIEIV